MSNGIAAFFGKIGAFCFALTQLVVGLFPISYKGDQVWPDPAKYKAPVSPFATKEAAQAAGGGWYVVMDEEFDKSELPAPWVTSPHYLRNKEWWCPHAVRVEGGKVVASAWLDDNYVCPEGICEKTGNFAGKDVIAGGIETREMIDGKSVSTFEQAFGYFEAKVKAPRENGMWTAFWLQSNSQGQVGNKGRDGTEIDVYESVFTNNDKPNQIAHALIWDGYGRWGRTHGQQIDMGVDMYEGWHTYGLLWTPQYYVFIVDGRPTWKSVGGGVMQVPAFLRLTIEARPEGSTNSAWGTPMRPFTATKDAPAEFEIDYVRVYQNTEFLGHIKSAGDFIDGGKLLPKGLQ